MTEEQTQTQESRELRDTLEALLKLHEAGNPNRYLGANRIYLFMKQNAAENGWQELSGDKIQNYLLFATTIGCVERTGVEADAHVGSDNVRYFDAYKPVSKNRITEAIENLKQRGAK